MSLLGLVVGAGRRVRNRLWEARVRELRFAEFGAGSIIEQPLGGIAGPQHIRIGAGVRIGPHAHLLTFPEVDGGPSGELLIGDRTVIMGRVDLGAARRVEIGPDVLIGANVTVRDADHGFAEAGVHRVLQPLTVAPVRIGPFVWIGQGAIILKGVEIGLGAVIGAGSVVTHAVRPGEIVAGNPARHVGWAAGAPPAGVLSNE